MFLTRLNPVEPPWYGPVRPVVWEGWRREASPYPDLRRVSLIPVRPGEGRLKEPTAATQRWRRELVFMPTFP
jgi:hypothetical protein